MQTKEIFQKYQVTRLRCKSVDNKMFTFLLCLQSYRAIVAKTGSTSRSNL